MVPFLSKNEADKIKGKVLLPLLLFIIGIVLGALSKLLDIDGKNIGEVLSRLSIWILFGTIIAIYSKTKIIASVNIFLFCIGMLTAYYVTAEITSSIYSIKIARGWMIFALFSPVLAYFTWMTKEKGICRK